MDIKTGKEYCEHLLPCGQCNKYDKHCHLYKDYLNEIGRLYYLFNPKEKENNLKTQFYGGDDIVYR